jgi:hypothetical protein
MGASAGRYAVGIGTGAASGAGLGAFGGPPGAIIGGVIGGGLGALQTLLSSSDEAKERKKQLDAYNEQRAQALQTYQHDQEQKYYDEWEQRYAQRTGANHDPMYVATHHKSYDPAQAEAEFNAHAGSAPTFPDEPAPNYAALAQSLGSLGSTVGTLNRQSALEDKLGAAQIQSSGNPWIAYAGESDDPMQQIVERARQAAWQRTGGW